MTGELVERLLCDFYLSRDYNPKAARPADNVKAAIAFTLAYPRNNSAPSETREACNRCESCGSPLYPEDYYAVDENGVAGCLAAMTDPPAEGRPCYASRVGKADANEAAIAGEARSGETVEQGSTGTASTRAEGIAQTPLTGPS